MDFVGMFAQMAEDPAFTKKVALKFAAYCEEKKIPAMYRQNHATTFNTAAAIGAEILAEIIGETMEKHPYLAKQAAKMMGVENGGDKVS